jgi:hypothetical protein
MANSEMICTTVKMSMTSPAQFRSRAWLVPVGYDGMEEASPLTKGARHTRDKQQLGRRREASPHT